MSKIKLDHMMYCSVCLFVVHRLGSRKCQLSPVASVLPNME